MPIGRYEQREQNHATPEQTVEMCREMGARPTLPIHWRTFVSPSGNVEEPIEHLRAALEKTQVKLALEEIGAT